MKFKKFMALGLVAAMTATLFAGCGSKGNDSADATQKSDSASADGLVSYSDIVLGETGKDLSATITMFNHRTDMDTDDYGGKNWKSYLEDFNKEYPNIKVEITTDTNYADDALTHLQSGQYETITMIPAVDKADLSTYYMSYGTLDEMSQQINYANTWLYGDDVYGVPSTATTQGIVYNKKVFEDAGVTDIPKTPDEFIDALKKIKDKTDAIPLYTNYAAGWTMVHGMLISETMQLVITLTSTRSSFTQRTHSRITAMAHIHMQYTRSFTMQLLADLPRMTILQLTGKALRAC